MGPDVLKGLVEARRSRYYSRSSIEVVMHRREFLAALVATSVTPQHAAQAQPTRRTYRIAVVEPTSAQLNTTNLAALRRGLEELGYAEGRNLVLDYRSADGNAALYPSLVAEVIGRSPDLIIARGTPAALAVKRATRTIPTVMIVGEPLLVVDSLARPGGNITGFSGVQPELETKRMELLKEIAPSTTGLAALLNMGNPVSAPQLEELQKGAQSRGWRFRLFDVRKRRGHRASLCCARQEFRRDHSRTGGSDPGAPRSDRRSSRKESPAGNLRRPGVYGSGRANLLWAEFP